MSSSDSSYSVQTESSPKYTRNGYHLSGWGLGRLFIILKLDGGTFNHLKSKKLCYRRAYLKKEKNNILVQFQNI